MKSKALGYGRIYMRTLENGSMSYGIALRVGFKPIPGVYQSVEKERVNGKVESMQNIFLDLDLKSLNKDDLREGIKIVSPVKSIER